MSHYINMGFCLEPLRESTDQYLSTQVHYDREDKARPKLQQLQADLPAETDSQDLTKLKEAAREILPEHAHLTTLMPQRLHCIGGVGVWRVTFRARPSTLASW